MVCLFIMRSEGQGFFTALFNSFPGHSLSEAIRFSPYSAVQGKRRTQSRTSSDRGDHAELHYSEQAVTSMKSC